MGIVAALFDDVGAHLWWWGGGRTERWVQLSCQVQLSRIGPANESVGGSSRLELTNVVLDINDCPGLGKSPDSVRILPLVNTKLSRNTTLDAWWLLSRPNGFIELLDCLVLGVSKSVLHTTPRLFGPAFPSTSLDYPSLSAILSPSLWQNLPVSLYSVLWTILALTVRDCDWVFSFVTFEHFRKHTNPLNWKWQKEVTHEWCPGTARLLRLGSQKIC